MPANTTPDGITYPVSTDQVSPLETVFANMANSMQSALNMRGTYTYRWANAAARTAQTGMRFGDHGLQVDTKVNYIYGGTVWSVANPSIRIYRPTGSDIYFGTGGSGANIPMINTSFNDSVDFYTNVSGTVKVLIPGMYNINWALRYDNDNNVGIRDALILINGVQKAEAALYTSSSPVIPSGSLSYRLAANDVINVYGYANAPAVTRTSANDIGDTGITVTYLGS